MKLWRLDPRRSLRWQVRRALRGSRTVRGWAWSRSMLARVLRRSDWRLAFLASFCLCLPLIAYLGSNQPGWLSGAWQVSAILVTLVLALVIFLLQAAGAQSLRTAATYRALVGSTLLIWPLALTLVFLAWVGIIGRFGDPHVAPLAWVDTYALALFVLQIAGFAAVFVRMLQLIAPQAVLRVIEQAFSDDISEAVYQKLARREGENLFAEAAEAAGVTSGPFSGMLGGTRIEARRAGRIVDVDLWLPKTLKDYGVASQMSVGVSLGARVQTTTALARSRGQLRDWLDRAVREAFVLRRSHAPGPEPLDVFSEALDIARRAVKDGSRATMRDAADLLVACITTFPRSYQFYGAAYDASTVGEGFFPSAEDRLLHELRRLIDEVLRAGDDDAVMTFTELGFRLVSAGVDRHAPYLVNQAIRFWISEAFLASARVEQPRRGEVLGALSEQAKWARDQLRYLLQDDSLPDEDRYVDVVPALADLFGFQATLLRITAEADEVAGFTQAWGRSINWNEHWTPEYDVEDLVLELEPGTEQDNGPAARKLEAARRAADVKALLDHAYQLAMFQAGAWLANEMRKGTLDRSRWEELLTYLVGAFSAPQDIVDAMARFSAGEDRLDLLRTWQMEWLTEEVTARRPDDEQVANRWATVLLLRMSSETQPPTISLGANAESLGGIIIDQLAVIEDEHEEWDSAVTGDLQAKSVQMRAAIEAARRAAAEEAERVLADAELSDERVAEFRQAQREAFDKPARLRARLNQVGVLLTDDRVQAPSGVIFGEVWNKRLFVEGAQHSVVIGWTDAGERAARDQQYAIAARLAEAAERVPAADPMVGAAEAVDGMRAVGRPPDAVLIPARTLMRPILAAAQPDFQWAHRGPGDRAEIGFLRDVPVLDVLPMEAQYVLIVNFQGALRVVERREPGESSPLQVDVRPITAARAAELIDAGQVPASDEPAVRANLVRALTEQSVEVFVEVAYDVTLEADASDAVKRVALGPEAPGV